MRAALVGLVLAAAVTNPSQIKFKASGGTSRDLALKLADIASVKDFGALCDGTTDDSAAFALAKAAALRVYVPQGTCSLGTTGFSFSNGTSLIGSGEQASVLTYSGTGCAITIDGVQGWALQSLKVVTSSSSAGVRGVCVTATGAVVTEFGTMDDVYFVQNNASHRIAGQIGMRVYALSGTGVQWNRFHAQFNFWDTSVELDGDGSNQPNSNTFYVVSAASNTPMYLQRANDNGIKIRCTTSDATLVAGVQTCLTVGDGASLSAGNVASVFSDQGATGKGVALAALSSKNYVIDDNESSIASTDSGTNNNLISIGAVCCGDIYRWRLDSIQATGRFQSAGIASFGSGINTKRRAIADTTATMATSDYGLYYTSISATRIVTMESAGTGTNFQHEICDESGSAAAGVKIQVLAPAGQTVNGTANPTPVDCVAAAYGCCHVRSAGGTAWFKW